MEFVVVSYSLSTTYSERHNKIPIELVKLIHYSMILENSHNADNLSNSFTYRSIAARRPTATHKFRLPIALRRLAACVLGASLILLRGKSRQKRA